MNCQRFTDVVSELARGQMMEADVRTDALGHSEACEKCAARLVSEQALTRALHTLSVQLQTKRAPGGLEFDLRKTFREQHAASAAVVVASSGRRYWFAVAAAVLLLLGGVVAIRMRDSQPTPGEKQIATRDENAGPKSSPGPKNVAIDPSSHESQKKPRFRPRERVASAVRKPKNRRASDVATNHAREIATEFIPLSYSNGASLQDGGQIVRVELPRSALVSFGIPVNMERLNEKVKADVWLGVDGFAHAIRFVQ